MLRGKTYWAGALGVVLLASTHAVKAQDAKQIVQQAVDTQLAADRNDNSHWRYVETERGGDKFVVVETENGALKRHIDADGKPALASRSEEHTSELQSLRHLVC